MSVTIPKERPPFVRFEEREHGVNAEASQKAGRPIPAVRTMVIVTSPGSKDELVAIADEWLKNKRTAAIQGLYNPDWVTMFEAQFEAHKKGEELPREGTPIQTWAAINNEQRVRLKALGYTTVEDLAQLPDSGLGAVGLDGRHLRDLARNWISEGLDKGINARTLADAQTTIADQQQLIEGLRERLAAMEARLDAQEQPAGGRRPRSQQPATLG